MVFIDQILFKNRVRNNKNNIKFDWVVRCRSDLLYYNNYLDLSTLNKEKILQQIFNIMVA